MLKFPFVLQCTLSRWSCILVFQAKTQKSYLAIFFIASTVDLFLLHIRLLRVIYTWRYETKKRSLKKTDMPRQKTEYFAAARTAMPWPAQRNLSRFVFFAQYKCTAVAKKRLLFLHINTPTLVTGHINYSLKAVVRYNCHYRPCVAYFNVKKFLSNQRGRKFAII